MNSKYEVAYLLALAESLYLQTGRTIFLFFILSLFYLFIYLFIYYSFFVIIIYLFLSFVIIIVIIIIMIIVIIIRLFVFRYFSRHHLHHIEGSAKFNQNMPPQTWEIHDSGQMP